MKIKLSLLTLFIQGSLLQGTVLFHDNFSGTAGAALTDYNSNYSVTGTLPQTLVANISAPGLTYPNFASSGNAVFLSGSNTSNQGATFTRWNNAEDFTNFTTNTPLYFSFLVQVPESGTTGGFIGLEFQMGPASNESQRNLRVGIRQSGDSWFLGGVRDSGTGLPNSGADVSHLRGQTILVAGQVAGIGTGWSNPTVSLYLNPTPGDVIPATASASFSGGNASGGVNLTSVSLFLVKNGGNNQSFSGIIDEVRFSTTWADVTPIPEPSTYAAIFGLLALSVVAWRRRRK